MNLESIVNTAKNIAHDLKNTGRFVLETAVYHPVLTGITTTIATGAELVRTQAQEENIFCYGIIAGIATHALCRTIKEYFYTPQEQKIKQQAITAVITASIAGIVTFPDSTTNAETKTSMFLASYTLVNSLMTLINAQKELKQFYDTQKNKTIPDKILEKPHIPTLITGTATFAYFAQKFGYGYEHYPTPTFALNTILATTAATATLFVAILTAAITHSSTRKYCKLSIKKALQKIAGNYEGALETITELEKTASQHTKAATEIEKAELTMCKGEYGKGMLMLKDAIHTKTTTTRNPFELLLDISGITTLTALYTLFTGIFQEPRKLIEQGLTSNKTQTTSTLTGMAVNSEKENLDNRLLSIYFHATTGDQYEADRELRKIIHQTKQQDFKTIAFSSDEFSTYPLSELLCTIGLKCSKNELSYERDATHIFNASAQNKKQIAQPLALAQKIKHSRHSDGPRDYFCIAYITGIPLSKEQHPEKYLHQALELVITADIHAQEYDCKQQIIKHTNYFTLLRKLVKRITKNEEARQELYQTGAFMPAYLSQFEPEVIHGNAHSGNILKQQDQTLCIIDFGDACRGQSGFDIEDITSSLKPEIQRTAVYEHSLTIMNKPLTKQELKRLGYSSVLRTAYLLGRSIAYQEGNPAKAYETTVNVIQEIKELTHEKLLFERFSDAFKHLCQHLQKEQYAH